jgi:NADH-quinone oxidoreductase subunit E
MEIDLAPVKEKIERYRNKKGVLIPLLQEVQAIYGYVPKEAINYISEELSIFPVNIYGILTFYKQFYLTPRGRHNIRVCQGTACHVMGAKELLNYMEKNLGIEDGETTEDKRYSLERVACLGCCGMAPVVVVDDDFYGHVSINNINEFLDKYE